MSSAASGVGVTYGGGSGPPVLKAEGNTKPGGPKNPMSAKAQVGQVTGLSAQLSYSQMLSITCSVPNLVRSLILYDRGWLKMSKIFS